MSESEFVFSAEHMLPQDLRIPPRLRNYRNYLHSSFNRQVGLLLESKRPRPQHSRKGRLDTRRAYRFPFSENIFKTYQDVPSSDTTIIMLIDGSGSMSNSAVQYEDYWIDRLEVASAICSAFGKSIRDVLKDELKLEVFVKSAPGIRSENSIINGDFVSLTRVFTNTHAQDNGTYDNLLRLQSRSPINLTRKGGCEATGSVTPEYAVLPGLIKWMKKNITTKNVIVFNLTDGDTYCTIGGRDFQFRNENTKQLRVKYLRGIPNLSMMIGRDSSKIESREVYGKDTIFAGDGIDSVMFKTLMRLLKDSYE